MSETASVTGQKSQESGIQSVPVTQGTTQAQRVMLDRWAANINERRAIENFLDWCQEEHSVELCEWVAGANWPRGYQGGAQKLLDLYHEIDQQQLDRERRALLVGAGR